MNTWLNMAMAALVATLVSPPTASPTTFPTTPSTVPSTAPSTTANDSLASARDLYAAAAYEDALEVLNRLPGGSGEGETLRAISEYRAYCLLALGRGADAERAIAAVVLAAPLYQPSGAEVSPRVRSAFSAVRRRMLPEIIRRKYATAKAMFDAREFAQARDAFGEVVVALADSDVASLPGLADLATLATGFRDLSASAAEPVPLTARTQPVSMTSLTAAPRLYGSDDPGVMAPVSIRQVLPPFSLRNQAPHLGVLELVIDQSGAVETATMRASVDPQYDQQLLAATKHWRFAPATINGSPVRYRKIVQVSVQP